MYKPFETNYATQRVLERELILPMDDYDKTKGDISIGYKGCPQKNKSIKEEEKRDPYVYWTNDEPDSLFKIGYPDHFANILECNLYLNDSDVKTDKKGNRLYYKYNCINYYKLVYITSLNDTPYSSFSFKVNTPKYTATPYSFIHEVNMMGRRMNSFQMFFSTRLLERLENAILEWTVPKGVGFMPVNSVQLITVPTQEIRIPLSEVKLQMCVPYPYLYWVVETLIRNYEELKFHGMERFKFTYLVGEFHMNSLAEVYPDAEESKGINTYGSYRRELLNAPNVVFYLKSNANYSKIADLLCQLFPEKHDLCFGVPRFNMRLNRNVYISFGGNNETKFNLDEMCVPTEYKRILALKNPGYQNLSKIFSGHTIMNEDGSENNIQSYKKLIPFITGGSFGEWYTFYGLDKYYNEVFHIFNQEMNALDKANETRLKSIEKSIKKSPSPNKSSKNRNGSNNGSNNGSSNVKRKPSKRIKLKNISKNVSA